MEHVRRKCESNIFRLCPAIPVCKPNSSTSGQSIEEKHDHIAVGERVFMVFDVTIRPPGQVGLEPGAGLKRFTLRSLSDDRMHGIVYAGRAVVLQ